MEKKETIIIGAGMAGLGCARTLHAKGRKFTIISENIGGRVCTSEDGEVNYGAYFVGDDNTHILQFTKKTKRVNWFDVEFHSRGKRYFLASKETAKLWQQMLILIIATAHFRRHFKRFRKNCETMSQKEAIERDPFLRRLYKKRAGDVIKELGIRELMDQFVGEIAYGFLFDDVEKISAFEMFHYGMYLLVPLYEFRMDVKKATKGFARNIVRDSVVSVKKKRGGYKIKTKKKVYWAKNVVVATPTPVSKKLLHLKKVKGGISAYMFHLKGNLRKEHQGAFEAFKTSSKIICIVPQSDGTYLVYARTAKPNFRKYFTKHEIVAKRFWNPAFNMIGTQLVEAKRGPNLYLVGDHNVCGLEDAYITGVYAANQILKQS